MTITRVKQLLPFQFFYERQLSVTEDDQGMIADDPEEIKEVLEQVTTEVSLNLSSTNNLLICSKIAQYSDTTDVFQTSGKLNNKYIIDVLFWTHPKITLN